MSEPKLACSSVCDADEWPSHYVQLCVGKGTYAAFQLADEHGAEERTGILRVADILERLGGVLAGLGNENLVTTGVLCGANRSESARVTVVGSLRFTSLPGLDESAAQLQTKGRMESGGNVESAVSTTDHPCNSARS